MKFKVILIILCTFIVFPQMYAKKRVVKIHASYKQLTKKKGMVYCKVVSPSSPIDSIYVMSNAEFVKKVDWVERMKHMGFSYQIILRIKSSRQVKNKIYYFCSIIKRVGPKHRSGGM